VVENKENVIEPRPGLKKRKELDVTKWMGTERKKSEKDIKKKSEHPVADEDTLSRSWSMGPLRPKKVKKKRVNVLGKNWKIKKTKTKKLVMFQY
jgi:hypothetical protein